MDELHIEDLPELRDPLFVMAFAGWNDAAESATGAARHIVDHREARRIAWFDPDPFFQYSDQRPMVRLDASGRRRISWPKNEFFYCRGPGDSRDLVVGVGVEPHLKWKSFGRAVVELVHRCRVQTVVTMGALLAGELHTNPIRLVALATDPALGERLGAELTKYEGPTGIVGVIHSLLQDEGTPAVSLWANVPHYIAGLSNPKAVFALLDRLRQFGGFPLELEDLERSIERFEREVDEAVAKDPKISAYITGLGGAEHREEGAEGGDLPPGDEVADEIERLLRRRRRRRGEQEEE